jgi:polyketide cyclase/dehydrase/lipid transport protein
VPAEAAGAHLADVESWPSWAKHINRVELIPPGPLTPRSEGKIHLTNGRRSTFRMEELDPHVSWKWAGEFLWLTVHYDHRLRSLGPNECELTFSLDGEGARRRHPRAAVCGDLREEPRPRDPAARAGARTILMTILA